ncbi:MAG: reverse transcriptase/maturase family protein [Caldilineaceae bacterium]|nr:reverse transcriptase/maturase family protein [Caldilineaceae bacterium]
MLTKTEQIIAIYSKRGDEGKRLQRVYRQLFKPELYKEAYAEIRSNPGAITKGTSEETLDGMSEERFDKIIEKLKKEKYNWKPVRRVEIPKGNGEKRPLGLPSGDDKLLQTAMKILLEAYYEPKFSNRSHGFRKGRGCQTALYQITGNHMAASWFIEGDIKGCFDNINHNILIDIVGESIDDGRILNLLRKLLKAGYMEGWEKRGTYSGTPQGGVISPLLANIYLDKLDKWIEKELLPKYNRSLRANGERRRNPEYQKYANLRTKAKKKGDIEAYKAYGRKMRDLPSVNTQDEGYRKLEYVRYADDFLLSFAGPKTEAEEIKREISKFLKERLKLEMSEEKTLITHARTDKAKFLGYEIGIFQSKDRKTVNGNVELRVPREVITKASRKYSKKQKPIHRPELEYEGDMEIIWQFQAEYRGLVEYYRMAHNLHALSKSRMAGTRLPT